MRSTHGVSLSREARDDTLGLDDGFRSRDGAGMRSRDDVATSSRDDGAMTSVKTSRDDCSSQARDVCTDPPSDGGSY